MFKKIDNWVLMQKFLFSSGLFKDSWLSQLFSFDIQVLLDNNWAGLFLIHNRAWLFLKMKYKETLEISFACNQHLFPTNAMPSQPEEKWLLKAGVLSNYCWLEQVINAYMHPGLH